MKPGPVVGLAGDVCAGKSSVSARFKTLGAQVWDADGFVRKLYEKDDVKADVRRLFGNAVFNEQGQVDRGKIGNLVFEQKPELLAQLTGQILYPRTGAAIREEIQTFRNQTVAKVLLLDAPTLFESGTASVCDRLLWVSAPLEVRSKWAAEKRGWPAGEIERRESRMLPAAEKRAKCQEVIHNNGTLDELNSQVDRIWKLWTGS